MKQIVLFSLSIILINTAFSQPSTNSLSSLKLIGQLELPFNKNFKNTVIGGISGIDYDAKNDLYYLISDDRSAKNEARFYTAKIHFAQSGIDSVQIMNVTTLLMPNGKPYPSVNQQPKLTPDPESIRYNSISNDIIWASEGERTLNEKDTVLQNPTIQVIEINGKFKTSFPTPPILEMHTKPIGPRQNGTLEGLTFTSDFNSLFACMEEPLFQDGPKAEITETNSYVRIFKFDVKSRSNVAQYAYKLENVAFPPTPQNAFKVNGVSEILYYATNQLLVVERSFSTGRLPCTVKVFLADISQAENIASSNSLIEKLPKKLATKKLVLNMDDLGIFIDNIEGLTFGPTLKNGRKTLLFVADNNFQPFEKNQFLLFEIVP